MVNPEIISIEGSHGEGGGQILRTALALAALLQQPIQVDNIRANREQPGLKTQHLAGVRALTEITAAKVQGDQLHSTSLVFVPRTIKGGKYNFSISTAGSACLLFAAVLPPLLFASQASEVTITGGTHVPWSPSFHYLTNVFIPILHKLGGIVSLELKSWGFYPKGGGKIRAYISPCRSLQAIKLQKRGNLLQLRLYTCSSSQLPEHVNRREITHVAKRLAEYQDQLKPESISFQSRSPGNFVFLEAEYENTTAGFSALGKRGRPAEDVAEEVSCAFKSFTETAATTDSHLADQIIMYLALAQGNSLIMAEKITDHLTTNIDIIKKILPIDVEMNSASGQLRVAGSGFNR